MNLFPDHLEVGAWGVEILSKKGFFVDPLIGIPYIELQPGIMFISRATRPTENITLLSTR